MSCVRCHMSHVMCHMFFLFLQSGGGSFYQWGPPRLVYLYRLSWEDDSWVHSNLWFVKDCGHRVKIRQGSSVDNRPSTFKTNRAKQLCLEVWEMFWRSGGNGSVTHWLNQFLNDKAVCGTALATSGLLLVLSDQPYLWDLMITFIFW